MPSALFGFARWLVRRKRDGKPFLLDPGLFALPHFRIGISQQMLQQIALGGSMIVIPIFLQIALEYNALEAGLAIAPLSLSMFVVALVAGKRAGDVVRPAIWCAAGSPWRSLGMILVIPVVPRAEASQGAWVLLVPLLIAGSGLGLLVSQLNNYTLAPIEEERASEAAGVNSAGGNFGLSFGLAVAGGIMLATLSFSFTALTNASTVIPEDQKQTVAVALEDNAEIVSDTQLAAVVDEQPPAVQEEILAINDAGPGTVPSGRDARAGPRLPAGSRQRLPHGATPRHRAVLVDGGTGFRLMGTCGASREQGSPEVSCLRGRGWAQARGSCWTN